MADVQGLLQQSRRYSLKAGLIQGIQHGNLCFYAVTHGQIGFQLSAQFGGKGTRPIMGLHVFFSLCELGNMLDYYGEQRNHNQETDDSCDEGALQ